MKLLLPLLCILSTYFVSSWAASAEEWKSRTIYQILTDRFGRSDKSTSDCSDLSDYCGGTFQGILHQLDYIQDLGFDAIWISPIPKNSPGGYHGYWQEDFYAINSHFGTKEDLHKLIRACHSRGIWVMLDVVANHVAPVEYDYSTIVPFNSSSHYHGCEKCPENCHIQDWNNQEEVEICRLAGLPDLDQDNKFVADTLIKWIADVVKEYSFDGIRIDTVPEIAKPFWTPYVEAGGCYAVGEVYNGNVDYVSSYQQPRGPLPAVLSYPLFFALRHIFTNHGSMNDIESVLQEYSKWFEDLDVMGTFIDNHDQARFLHNQRDYKLYEAALTYVLLGQGIPIIYYGTEQGFSGGDDPLNREALWATNYKNDSQLYQFIKTVITYRKKAQVWKHPQVQRYSDHNFYAFTRGDTFVALTNGGSGLDHVLVSITYHPYKNGQRLCNLFYPTTDCFVVKDGKFDIYLKNGESKIYYPA